MDGFRVSYVFAISVESFSRPRSGPVGSVRAPHDLRWTTRDVYFSTQVATVREQYTTGQRVARPPTRPAPLHPLSSVPSFGYNFLVDPSSSCTFG